MKPRSAIKTDLFAFDAHHRKIDKLGDPQAEIESYIDFASLAAKVARGDSKKKWGTATESNSVAIIVLEWIH